MLTIRLADSSEIGWINKCYDEVEFVHSVFEKEIIAIAEWDGQKIGLGRLVTLDDYNLELGGTYVFESYRGKGVAKELVTFLLTQAPSSKIIYCIPFDHLLHFYQQCGFAPCPNLEQIPNGLLKKYQWCKEKYAHSTSLLRYISML